MTARRRRLLEDRQLRGLAPRTQPWYLEAVTHLTHHGRRAPDQMSEAELRPYCLFLINDTKVAERTLRVHLDGIRFFSERTLQRPWPVFDFVLPRNTPQLPVVLSLWEVRSLLALVEPPKARRCLRMMYACGLRLTAGTQLQVSDIDAQRMLGRVHQGTGGTDRFVQRAPRGLALWRAYWRRQRPRPWVFPARDGSAPLSPTALHKPCTVVVRQSGIPKEASIQTRQHASATHLKVHIQPTRATPRGRVFRSSPTVCSQPKISSTYVRFR
jgi:site-specific recombinase XerD